MEKNRGMLDEKRAATDRLVADNTPLWKIRIVIRCTGFRAVDIFRSIWSGNLNAQFEIRSQYSRALLRKEKRKGGWEGEGESDKIEYRKLARLDDANRRADTIESMTYRTFPLKYTHNSRIIVSVSVAHPGQTFSGARRLETS